MYASFFSLTNRKCLGVAILISHDDSYAFHRVDIRADGQGVAVHTAWCITTLDSQLGLSRPHRHE